MAGYDSIMSERWNTAAVTLQFYANRGGADGDMTMKAERNYLKRVRKARTESYRP